MHYAWAVGLTGFVAVAAIAQGTNRPPPAGETAPIKIGAAPTKPIKIGAPTPTPTPAKKTDGMVGTIGTQDQMFAAVLKLPLAPSVYTWKVGDAPPLMPTIKTHICVLSGVSGNFNSGEDRVTLEIDYGATGGARWRLSGTSSTPELRGAAICVSKAKFIPAALTGDQMVATPTPHHMNGACAPHIPIVGQNYLKRAYFISQMAGKWRGAGELLAVTMNAGKPAIRVDGCSGFVDGALTAYEDTTVSMVKYRANTERTTNTGKATFVLGQANPGGNLFAGDPFFVTGSDRWLVPMDEAVCGFVSITGKFQGYGESADIVGAKNPDGRLWWKLQLGNQALGGVVNAAIRCYARDQR